MTVVPRRPYSPARVGGSNVGVHGFGCGRCGKWKSLPSNKLWWSLCPSRHGEDRQSAQFNSATPPESVATTGTIWKHEILRDSAPNDVPFPDFASWWQAAGRPVEAPASGNLTIAGLRACLGMSASVGGLPDKCWNSTYSRAGTRDVFSRIPGRARKMADFPSPALGHDICERAPRPLLGNQLEAQQAVLASQVQQSVRQDWRRPTGCLEQRPFGFVRYVGFIPLRAKIGFRDDLVMVGIGLEQQQSPVFRQADEVPVHV